MAEKCRQIKKRIAFDAILFQQPENYFFVFLDASPYGVEHSGQ